MSLNIYSSILDVPEGMKVIRSNDLFFNGFTKLNNSDFEKTVLRDIDDATFVSPDLVIGRFMKAGAVYKSTLSTGAKTILNIEKHQDLCFDMLECGAINPLCNVYASRCGDNCAPAIVRLAEKTYVIITLHHMMVFPEKFEAVMLDTGVTVHSRREFYLEYGRITGIL